jgi:hypothetical protein
MPGSETPIVNGDIPITANQDRSETMYSFSTGVQRKYTVACMRTGCLVVCGECIIYDSICASGFSQIWDVAVTGWVGNGWDVQNGPSHSPGIRNTGDSTTEEKKIRRSKAACVKFYANNSIRILAILTLHV